jgi:RNA 3'-terminal phosphate cyclase (ATP)
MLSVGDAALEVWLMSEWITIDGSQGEGGGQILRTALALSIVTGRPLQMDGIRAGRQKPGLLRQHLTAVHAAVVVSGARASGAELGSKTLTFEPSQVRGGEHHLAVGTAGSVTLVLQAVLPPLLLAREPSRLTLEGGTHNPGAPPFEFLARTFVPLLRRMGAQVEVTLARHGFYPAGGGQLEVTVEPCSALQPLALLDRGETRVCARGLVACIPESIAKRELGVTRARLGLERSMCRIETMTDSAGPGNALIIEIASESVTEVITGFGIKGVTAEQVASDACKEAEAYLAAGVPVGRHLADQLLLPLALAGGGTFRSLAPTAHTTTNIDVIQRFLDVPIAIDREHGDTHRITVGRR